ncbi:hypothetical protein PB2503_11869 [Parvularcula bermudensis HTCC2503]|uniref:Uncharacterized protein n=1 Tax=Parvularcula bermudensis (strain ATCC BAA-594 / HTCC2503 / KCTC 12087) TaxID=314260 RepID=E0TDW9_PARBH|nr:hypothetical protein [Parvularcula bermudensis]ADM10418.1 hypothetical protein PB2503_11869 [Parvularcula bermudensis HTCC2503]
MSIRDRLETFVRSDRIKDGWRLFLDDENKETIARETFPFVTDALVRQIVADNVETPLERLWSTAPLPAILLNYAFWPYAIGRLAMLIGFGLLGFVALLATLVLLPAAEPLAAVLALSSGSAVLLTLIAISLLTDTQISRSRLRQEPRLGPSVQKITTAINRTHKDLKSFIDEVNDLQDTYLRDDSVTPPHDGEGYALRAGRILILRDIARLAVAKFSDLPSTLADKEEALGLSAIRRRVDGLTFTALTVILLGFFGILVGLTPTWLTLFGAEIPSLGPPILGVAALPLLFFCIAAGVIIWGAYEAVRIYDEDRAAIVMALRDFVLNAKAKSAEAIVTLLAETGPEGVARNEALTAWETKLVEKDGLSDLLGRLEVRVARPEKAKKIAFPPSATVAPNHSGRPRSLQRLSRPKAPPTLWQP